MFKRKTLFIDTDAAVPQSPLDFDDGKRLSNASDKIAAATAAHPEIEEDEELQNLSLWDIVKLNNAEWPQIFLGCLSSFVMGATMPIFAILFGEIIGVITKICQTETSCFISMLYRSLPIVTMITSEGKRTNTVYILSPPVSLQQYLHSCRYLTKLENKTDDFKEKFLDIYVWNSWRTSHHEITYRNVYVNGATRNGMVRQKRKRSRCLMCQTIQRGRSSARGR